MRRLAGAALAAAMSIASQAVAEGEEAGDFDYYVLALSWSPTWCALEGRGRDAAQCEDGSGYGWILHGLWPQYEDGWPSYCPTNARNPSRRMTGAMADITASGGLAWHAWNKHGRCSGLTAAAYFDASRSAYDAVRRPSVFRELEDPVTLPARIVEEAFLEANPDLAPDGITITCQDGHIDEVRICLTKDLAPRTCGRDVRRDCRMTDARFLPLP